MSNKINVILTIIIIILVSYVIFDFYKDNNKSSNIVNEKTNNTDENDIKYYYYKKNIESDKDEDIVYKSIYLFADNTYYYGFSNKNDKCNYWSKGNYEYKDNYLILNETKYGGCSTCYYTDNVKTHRFRVANGSLVSNDNEMLTEAKLDILPIIDVEKLEGVKHCSN